MKKTEQPTDRASMRRFMKAQEKLQNPPKHLKPHPGGSRVSRRSTSSDLRHNNPRLKGSARHRQEVDDKQFYVKEKWTGILTVIKMLQSGELKHKEYVGAPTRRVRRVIFHKRFERCHINMKKISHQKLSFA